MPWKVLWIVAICTAAVWLAHRSQALNGRWSSFVYQTGIPHERRYSELVILGLALIGIVALFKVFKSR